RLIEGRAPLVDESVEALHASIVFADPATGLGVIERMQHGVSVEDRIVPPAAVLRLGGLALGLEKLVPRGARVPHLYGRPDTGLREHLPERLEVRAPVDQGTVHRDVDA